MNKALSWAKLQSILNPTADELRREANVADARARSAERDGDIADASKWHEQARQLRRRARSIEFGS